MMRQLQNHNPLEILFNQPPNPPLINIPSKQHRKLPSLSLNLNPHNKRSVIHMQPASSSLSHSDGRGPG